MSYQLNREMGKKLEIEMPPLPVDNLSATETVRDILSQTEQISASDEQTTRDDLSHVEQTVDDLEMVENQTQNEQDLFQNQLQVAKPSEKAPLQSFRELREAKKRAEEREAELERKLKAYESASQKSQYEEPEYEVGSDDLVEGKHLNKYNKQIQRQQQEIEALKQQNQQAQFRTQLLQEMPDFFKVVSKENSEMLEMKYPDIARSLNSSTDAYSTAKAAYNIIKELRLNVEDNYQQEKAIVQKNAAKPRPLASMSPQQGDSPLSKANAFANGLTDELKTQLRKEMESARRAM